MKESWDDKFIELPLRYIFEHCDDWDEFCKDERLNPYMYNEGLADGDCMHSATIETFKKHGVL